jgi:lipoprotein-releasing system permease protein
MNSLAPFEWILATRFMREGLLQTSFIIAGVALGVSVIVFMSALLTGLQSNLFRRTLDFQGQIIITAPEEVARPLHQTSKQQITAALIQPRAQRLRSVDQWQKMRNQIETMRGVVVVTPVVSGAGFVIRADANRAVTLTGIEPETYLHLVALKDKIIAGSADVNSTDIVVGTELATDLGVTTNEKITLQTASGSSAMLKIRGIYDFGNKAANSRSVYVALHTAQSLLNLPGGATTLEINVVDPFSAQLMASSIETMTGLKAESWITANAEFFTALSGQSFTFLVIRLFVGLTAALGIASVLVVSVVQKSKEIGILRATGTTRKQILRLFLTQGALFGLFGSVLGSGLGWAFLAAWRGFAKNPDGTPFFVIDFEPVLFLYATIGAVLVGTLAAVFPAQRAARLDPAVAIRG